MVESLEEIARRRLNNLQAYENRYGEGSFERNQLARFVGKHTSVKGTLAHYNGKNFVLTDVTVGGIPVDHLNIKFTSQHHQALAFSVLHLKPRVTMKALISIYRRMGRERIGISNITSLQLPDLDLKAYSLPGLRSFFTLKNNSASERPVKGKYLENYQNFSKPLKKGTHATTINTLMAGVTLGMRKSLDILTPKESLVAQRLEPRNLVSFSLFLEKAYKDGSLLSTRFIFPKVATKYHALKIYDPLVQQASEQGILFAHHFFPYGFSVLKPTAATLWKTPIENIYALPPLLSDGSRFLLLSPFYSRGFAFSWSSYSLTSIGRLYGLPKGTPLTVFNPWRGRLGEVVV